MKQDLNFIITRVLLLITKCIDIFHLFHDYDIINNNNDNNNKYKILNQLNKCKVYFENIHLKYIDIDK